MLKQTIGALLLMTIALKSVANIHFTNFQQDDGLPDNKIWAITQDNKGFIWIGTGNGLAKFDGYSFTTYNLTDTDILSLPTNHIKSLYVDRADDLWIGTLGTGLIRLSKGQFEVYKLSAKDSPEDILTIHGTNELIWLGTEKGLYSVDLTTGKVTHLFPQKPTVGQQSESSKVNAIIDSGEYVYVAFDTKVLVFDSNGEFKETLTINFPDTKLRIRKLINESEQSLLIATNENLYRFALKGKQLEAISGEMNGTIILDALVAENKILASTFEKGLQVFDDMHYSYLNSEQNSNSLPNNVIITMFQSREGVIWLGTFDGLSKISPSLHDFKLFNGHSDQQNCFLNNNIMSVNSLENRTLLISSTEHVMVYEPIQNTCSIVKPPKERTDSLYQYTVYESLEDGNDDIWLASSYGLINISQQGIVKRSSPISQSNPRVYTLDFYGKSQLLAGTTQGVFLIDKDTLNTSPIAPSHPIASMAINSIRTKDGNAYIGAEDGLYKYNGSKVGKISLNTQIPIGRVTDILLSENSFFVASTRGVVYEISYGNETLINELYIDAPNHTKGIQAIELEDNNILWASTLNGLYRINRSTGDVNRYTKENGLHGDVFNIRSSTSDELGNIYFGGSKGITYFNPTEINIKSNEPKVVVTNIDVFSDKILQDGKETSHNDFSIAIPASITLSHSNNDFSIEFAALHFIAPENIQYAYKLEGANSEWIITGANNRTTTFSNLSLVIISLK